MMPLLLKKAEVVSMTSLSYPTLWRLMAAGKFPKSLRISPGRVAWRADDVHAWVAARAESAK